MSSRTVDEILAEARSHLTRVSAEQALDALGRKALLVDIRPIEQRRRDGIIPGSIAIDRNVLEWRLDPSSPYRTEELLDCEQQVIVVCDEGYASSLAAATLQQLGLPQATDLVGGFQAWRAAGLPTRPLP